MRMRTIVASILVTGAALVSTTPAHADGFAVNRFEPSERGSDWFVLDSLDMRGKVRPAIGVLGEWAYRPLVIYNSDGTVRASLVRDQVVVHLGGSITLFERLRLGVDLPVQVYADGNPGVFRGVQYQAPASSTTLGDLRLGLDLRLLGEYGGPFSAAIGARAWFPTGDATSYSGDTSVRIEPHLLVAGDIGIVAYGVMLGATYRDESTQIGGSPIGSDFRFGGSLGVRVADRKLLIGPEVYGSTIVSNSDAVFSTTSTPLEGLLGAHYTLADDWRLEGGVGSGLTRGIGAPVVRGVVAIQWFPAIAKPQPPADRDGDGVIDKDDACPDAPGPRTEDPRTNGCPPPADRDGDGVTDAEDACPDVPGVKTDDPKTNGCPPDKDGDGVYDKDDACPDVPGVKSDDPKANGCPSDRDKDGVLDKDDACPDVAGLKTSDPKTNGCPDPDRDKDGIANEQDACPDEPGKADPDPKKNGCPKAFVQAGQIKILDQVKFKTNSADILPGKDSEEVLQAVMGVLTAHPELKKVRVEGHTDDRGSAALNKKLSAARAASVVKWLVKHGVDKDRLTSQGFGPDRPIDKNDTEEGRRNNRRVEFHIEDSGQPPAPAP